MNRSISCKIKLLDLPLILIIITSHGPILPDSQESYSAGILNYPQNITLFTKLHLFMLCNFKFSLNFRTSGGALNSLKWRHSK